MPRCPNCGQASPQDAKFCARCATPLNQPEQTLSGVTADAPSPRPIHQPNHPTTPAFPPTPTATRWGTATSHARFTPGEVVADRYRITSLLGKGGMGEVYRADDLTLNQTVALKFLPPALAADPDRVQKLFDEVRVTRQVSHPNVCRVYDAHTINKPGEPPLIFLAMEFIDGEDLGSLLRRIGRLPGDKALEVARQLCAGLAAAHEQGVVHRDIKPSNIMLDGRGRARLTDFGIAGPLADIIASGDISAGTPTYMAPEQLNGQGVSVRSDIYALGLVLYELFTGKPVFRAANLTELRSLHATTDPTRPSTHLQDIDPLAERVILRCLEKDPAFRPASALAVSAALPGGDPLAAALAAGETPTPEMVAASGGTEASTPKFVLTCLAVFLAALAAIIVLKDHTTMVRRTTFNLSTEVLRAKASEFLQEVAPPPLNAGTACGFATNDQAVRDIDARLDSPDRWESLATGRPAGILFWHRTTPQPMFPNNNNSTRPTPSDPPMVDRGSTLTWFDAAGRLLEFRAIPIIAKRPVDPQAPAPTPAKSKPDWAPFFRAAALDPTKFTPAPPRLLAPVGTDNRESWIGEWPMQAPFSPIPIRVEAASFEGLPVLFAIVAAWHTAPPTPTSLVSQTGQWLDMGTYLFAVTAGPLLAWRHIRSGRGDRRGAWRLAVFALITTWLVMLVPVIDPTRIILIGMRPEIIARSVWMAAFAWLLYMALEPYIRRVAPWAVVSWTRLISGKPADALVGRDVMLGALLAIVAAVVSHAAAFLPPLLGSPPSAPLSPNWNWLGGPREAISMVLFALSNAVFIPMLMTIVMVGLRWLLRSDKWALVVLWLIGSFLIASDFGSARHALLIGAIIAVGYAIALVKYGLLTMSATFFTSILINSPPVSADFTAWYTPNWLFPYAAVTTLILFSAYTALGGRAGLIALQRKHASAR
jgi:serine/threonine protein kinase